MLKDVITPFGDKPIKDLKAGDTFWLKCTANSVDSDGEVFFSFLRTVETDHGEDHSRRNIDEDEEGENSVYTQALEATAVEFADNQMIGPQSIVTTKSDSNYKGKVVVIHRGQATIDWTWQEPNTLSPSVSSLPVGSLRLAD